MPSVSQTFNCNYSSGARVAQDLQGHYASDGMVFGSNVGNYASSGKVSHAISGNYSSEGHVSQVLSANYSSGKGISKGFTGNYSSGKSISVSLRGHYQPAGHGTGTPIVPASPSGVLPQQGSGIYDSWVRTEHKEIVVQRHWDGRESGALNYDDTRREWKLGMKVGLTKMNEILAFINSHFGAGIPFFFYDLEHNGFQYSATGTLADGRHLVRYVEDSFSQVQDIGSRSLARFSISFSVIEVE
jgi:hypothetical protein